MPSSCSFIAPRQALTRANGTVQWLAEITDVSIAINGHAYIRRRASRLPGGLKLPMPPCSRLRDTSRRPTACLPCYRSINPIRSFQTHTTNVFGIAFEGCRRRGSVSSPSNGCDEQAPQHMTARAARPLLAGGAIRRQTILCVWETRQNRRRLDRFFAPQSFACRPMDLRMHDAQVVCTRLARFDRQSPVSTQIKRDSDAMR